MEKLKSFAKGIVAVFTLVSANIMLLPLFNSVSAAGNPSDILPPPRTGETNLITFAQDSLNLVIGLAALVAVAFLVYSGFQYIIAQGDEGKVEKATKGITYAIVGLVICFISVLIVNFVLNNVLQAS
jgi:hypothetical protein